MATSNSDTDSDAVGGAGSPDGVSSGPEQTVSKERAFLSAVGICVVSLLLLAFFSLLLSGFYYVLTGSITKPATLLIENVGLVCSAVTLSVLYLQFTDYGTSFFDFKYPSIGEVGLGLGGAGILYIASRGIAATFKQFGITGSQHAIVELAKGKDAVPPEFFLLLVPMSILIIGPFEELIYRNIVQKSLYPAFGKKYGLVVASILFAGIHFPAYLTGTPQAALVTLTSVLALAGILGGLYAYTENLVVPAIAHGFYNGLLFVLLYADLTNLL